VSSGFSLGVDLAPPAGFLGIGPASRFLWRTEFRALPADERIFPRISLKRTAFSDMQSFIVSSFALTF
jgi:hypothetical protein